MGPVCIRLCGRTVVTAMEGCEVGGAKRTQPRTLSALMAPGPPGGLPAVDGGGAGPPSTQRGPLISTEGSK